MYIIMSDNNYSYYGRGTFKLYSMERAEFNKS